MMESEILHAVSLAASPAFLNTGNIKQWETVLVLAKHINIFGQALTPL